MSSVDKALATQLANIEKRTGKTLAELVDIVQRSGLAKHGELVAMLKRDLGMGHGDANTLVHQAKSAATSSSPTEQDPLDTIYVGPKAALRPIHEQLMKAIGKFGDFEIAPKKGYVSLRRKKQFAMIGPATNTRVEVGINLKGPAGTDRLEPQPEKSMCQFKVKLTSVDEVDSELVGWLRMAYEAAG